MANKNEGGRGFLETALTLAPVGVGVGVAIKRMRASAGGEVFSPARPDIFHVMKHARGFASPSVNRQVGNSLNWMSQHEASIRGVDESLVKTAWTEAVRFTDKQVSSAMVFTGGDTPAGTVYDAINQELRQNQSNTMLKTFQRFRTNLASLQQHQEAVQSLPLMQGIPYHGVKPTRFNFGAEVLEGGLSRADLPENISAYIKRFEEQGLRLDSAAKYTRPEFEGFESTMLKMYGPKGQGIDLLLPETKEGMLLEGTTLRTRYIAPDIAIFDPATQKITQRMSRSQYFLEEFNRSIMPAIQSGKITTQADIDAATRKLRDEVFHELETVSNVPTNLETEAQKRYQMIKGKALDIKVLRGESEYTPAEFRFQSAYRDPTEDEFIAAMRGGVPGIKDGKPITEKLYAGVSPKNLATGRVSTFDWGQLAMTPEAIDWGRRPEQANRLFGLTFEAQLEGKRYDPFRILDTPELKDTWGQMTRTPPQLRTLYVDPKKHGALMRELGIGEGEALAREELRSAFEQEAIEHAHLTRIEQGARELIEAGRGDELKIGQLVGWDSAGAPISVQEGQEFMSLTKHQSRSLGDFGTVHFKQRYAMGEEEKFFGDIKAMVRFGKRGQVDHALAKLGAIDLGYDIIASMDDLRKSTSANNKQIISSLYEKISANFAAGREHPLVSPEEVTSFLNNPIEMARGWSKSAVNAQGAYDHTKFLSTAMNFAHQGAGLSPEEFSDVFGSITAGMSKSEVVNTFDLAGMTPNAAAARYKLMEQGLASGRSQMFWDKIHAGGMGSVEPRAFEQLRSGATGQLGTEFADELAQRLVMTQPEAVATSDALMKSLRSMAGLEKADKGARIFDIAAESQGGFQPDVFQKWIEEGGGYMKVGKRFDDIYVPGMDTLKSMEPYITPGGNRVRGYLSDTYSRLAQKASRMHMEFGGIGPEHMRAAINTAITDLGVHAAPAGKGMGGYLRGPVFGSRYLANVTRIGDYVSKDVNEVGVHINRLEEMFEEMMPYASEEERAELQLNLEHARSGKRIGGWVARQPQIGAFSNQPVMVQPLFGEGSSRSIATPEIVAPLTFQNAKTGAEFTEEVSFGPNVGMAADKDADNLALYLVSPKHQKNIAKTLANADNEYMARYVQHQARMAIFKAKKGAGADALLSIEEKMIADARKLAVTQRFVPRLSVGLSEARQAVLSYSKGAQLADAQFLLEWMEQTPISAKHQGARDIAEGKMTEMLENLQFGLKSRNAGALEAQVRKVIASNENARAMLQDEFFLKDTAQAEQVLGRQFEKRLGAINIGETTNTIASALRAFSERGDAEAASLLAGRVRVNKSNLAPFLKIAQQASEGFSGMSKAAVASSNVVAAAGRGIIRNYKPLALGFAAALGVATVLSTPSDTIGPAKGLDNPDPQESMNKGKATNRMPQNVHPPSPPVGQPTAPGMMHRNSTVIAPPGRNEQMHIRARMNAGQAGSFNSQLSRVTGGARSVNVSVRDHRSKANQYIMANKIHG